MMATCSAERLFALAHRLANADGMPFDVADGLRTAATLSGLSRWVGRACFACPPAVYPAAVCLMSATGSAGRIDRAEAVFADMGL